MQHVQAMKVASSWSPTTVGELQQYLQDLQETWSAEDSKYLGKFKDQPIYFATNKGIGAAKCVFMAEFGLVAVSKELIPL